MVSRVYLARTYVLVGEMEKALDQLDSMPEAHFLSPGWSLARYASSASTFS
jgi:hypothetical protein